MALLDNVRKAKATFDKAKGKFNSVKEKVEMTKAKIQILDTTGKVDSAVEPLVFHYNPAEYKVTHEANYSETYAKEASEQIVQLSEIKTGKLNFSAVFDTYMTINPEKKDVSDAFKALEDIFVVNGEQDVPPKVLLQYGAMSFVGYVTNFSIDYTMFTRWGVPVRAKVDITMLLLNPEDVLDQSTTSDIADAKKEALNKISNALNLRKGL